MSTKISVKDILNAEQISIRNSVDVIAKRVEEMDSPEIDLDLTDIKFISRAFAHGLIDLQNNTKKSQIIFSNAIESVREMLETVGKNLSKTYQSRIRADLLPQDSTNADFFKN